MTESTYNTLYKEKIDTCTLLFKKVMSDFKREFDKNVEKGKDKVAKGVFGPTYDGVKNNKDSTKKKASFSRKKEKAIIIYKKCTIYKRPACKNIEAYYYAFIKIAFKEGAPMARTQEITNRNLKKKYVKEKLAEIRNKRARTAQGMEKSNKD